MFSKPKPSSSKGEKRKHVTLTLNQKLEIIKRLEKGENRNVLMNEFNIGSSTIYDIKKQKDELMKFASQSVTTEKLASRQTLKKPKLEQLDSVLFKWFSAVRSEGKPVTGPMIVEKAKKFGQDLGVAESECNYSDGWLRNFKFRHGIRRLDVTGETLSANQNLDSSTQAKIMYMYLDLYLSCAHVLVLGLKYFSMYLTPSLLHTVFVV